MLSSLRGTLSKFIFIPSFDDAASSTAEDVSPAAPISCIPTIASFFISSRHASINSFSVNGSPTCTVGFNVSDSVLKAPEDMLAP